ncbi:hypothetical protein CHUAL_007103 [Chamberlinius hualienensis]
MKLLILIAGLALCSCNTIDYCKRFGTSHTMCKYKANSGCHIILDSVDEEAKADILNAHNKFRQLVANGYQENQPSASNMFEMIWDDNLAEVAQRWANQCQFSHDENRRTEKFYENVGQNIASLNSAVQMDPTANFGRDAVKLWFDEVSLFNPSNIRPFVFGLNYGHYSQLAWGETYAVGCGYTYYRDKNGNYTKFYVCNYGPSGNFIGESVYQVGAPCSLCPNGCSRNYPGLCNAPNTGTDEKEGDYKENRLPELTGPRAYN